MPSLLPFSFYFGNTLTQVCALSAQILCPSSYNQTVVATLGHFGKLGIVTTGAAQIEQKWPAARSFFCAGPAATIYNSATSDRAKLAYTVAGGVGSLMGFGAPIAVVLVAGIVIGLGEIGAQKRRQHNKELALVVMGGEYSPGKQVASPNVSECLKDMIQFAIPVATLVASASPIGRVVGGISATVKIVSMAIEHSKRRALRHQLRSRPSQGLSSM